MSAFALTKPSLYTASSQADVENRFASEGLLRSQQTAAVPESHKMIVFRVIKDVSRFFQVNLSGNVAVRMLCKHLLWAVTLRSLTQTCGLWNKLPCSDSIREWKALIAWHMLGTLSEKEEVEVSLRILYTVVGTFKYPEDLSSLYKQVIKVDFIIFALISSSVLPEVRALTKSTATSMGRGSEAISEKRRNVCRRTSSLSENVFSAIFIEVVIVLGYASLSVARSFSVLSRSPREQTSR